MSKFRYLALGIIFVGLAFTYSKNGGTNLSNTPGLSCTSYQQARSVATDAKGRVHTAWVETTMKKGATSGIGELRLPSVKLTNTVNHSYCAKLVMSSDKDSGQVDVPGLFYRRSIDGGNNWEDTVRLADSVDRGASSIGTNDLDAVHIVWTDGLVHYKHSLDGGGTWGTGTVIAGDSTSSCLASVIGQGNWVHIAWREDQDYSLYRIMYIWSNDTGLTWANPTEIALVETRGVQVDNDVIVLAIPSLSSSDTLVHLVWQDTKDDTTGEIYYRRSVDNGVNWELERRLTDDEYISFWPSVASCGEFVHIGWLERNSLTDSCSRYWYLLSPNGGVSWMEPVQLIEDSPIDYLFGTPQLTAKWTGKGGYVALVWGEFIGTPDTLEPDIWAILYKYSADNGMTWHDAEIVRKDTTFCSSPSSSIDDEGNLHIVWTDMRDGNYETYYAKYPLTGVEERTNPNSQIQNPKLEVLPNPSFGNSVIRYTMPQTTQVSLNLYDLTGRLVRSIYSGKRERGSYTANIDGLQSGIYFIVLEAVEFKATRKLTILR
ncbi:MAG: T9SS type A sorting domain-containing protein [Candidatus Stahlbacteria bacterium]|nr:T9SS type A sorting domain-containing protein [Candidatus Stahlbacteria bacterium]